ncbi:MAG: hypothetical protein LBJ00_04630 [Planctomycetaceae bacterium]|jgi:hypothetical protein|nr:hypothetical protein [Planctomycetaceae bacterium]
MTTNTCFLNLIFFPLILLLTQDVVIPSQPAEKEKKLAELTLRGMDDTRKCLLSGVCQITGESREGTAGLKETKDDITIAFDFHKNNYRFDRAQKSYSLLTGDYFYELMNPGDPSYTQFVVRNYANKDSVKGNAKPFDIRALGFFNFIGPYWEISYPTYSSDILFNSELLTYKKEPNGIVLLEYKYKFSTRKFWIDSQNGYTLVRAEYNSIDTIELSWKKLNGVWVPESFQLFSTEGYFANWKIDWHSVNVPVPDEYFDPEKMSEKVAFFVSEELGEPVLLGKNNKDISLKEKNKMQYSHYFRLVLVVAGLILIVVSLCKKVYDRLRAKSRR